jgi:hypothetical protein
MTTRTSLACVFLGALVVAGTQRGDALAQSTAVQSGSEAAASPVVLRIDKDDTLTPRQLAQLGRGSAMARELLVRIANLRDTILILRADPALARKSGLYGRSRFWVAAGELFGYVEYQAGTMNRLGTQCLIVHELAHAVEIATADRRAGTPALRTFVQSRAIPMSPASSDAETDFPRQVALAVFAELQGNVTQARTLAQIAEVHHITLPSVMPVDGVLTAIRPH